VVKSLPIALLALVLALSGCSSSPSIEEQTKLIEYEKCLELYNDFYLLGLEKNPYLSNTTMNEIRERVKSEGKTLFSYNQEYCDKLRP
jgi:hypothetical protein